MRRTVYGAAGISPAVAQMHSYAENVRRKREEEEKKATSVKRKRWLGYGVLALLLVGGGVYGYKKWRKRK